MNTKNIGNSKHDIVVIENAFVDVLVEVKDSDLDELRLVKGTSAMMNGKAAAMNKFLAGHKLVIMPGGSGANVAAHSAGAGARTAFLGTIGSDEYGRFVEVEFKKCGVDAFLKIKLGSTGVLYSLITPDAERTMVLDPGNALDYEISDLNIGVIKNARFFHTSMYALADGVQKEATLFALETAKKAGGKISLDLANAPLVAVRRNFIIKILGRYVDIVVANEEEAKALFGSVSEAQKALPDICETSIIKLGAKGSVITYRHKVIRIFAFPVEKVVDTIGAGDKYIAMLLAYIAKGASIEEAGFAASKGAAEIVGRIGAR